MTDVKIDDSTWFTEKCPLFGSAFSLATPRKLHEEITPYQTIEVYETSHYGHLMVIDGCYMVSQLENFFYHEMLSHTALFTHPNPINVVIIGGGDCGTLHEVLKHESVKKAVQVEIDERVTRLAEKYFPELCASNNDPRAELVFGDGIAWIKAAPAQSIDVIIVDSTDPVGPAEGLFTEHFYRDCLRALSPKGILIQQSESPLYHQNLIASMHTAMRKAEFSQTQLVHFPQPIYPSGWWSATLASASLPLRYFREQAALNKTFATRYYNAGIHHGALALPEFLLELDR